MNYILRNLWSSHDSLQEIQRIIMCRILTWGIGESAISGDLDKNKNWIEIDACAFDVNEMKIVLNSNTW